MSNIEYIYFGGVGCEYLPSRRISASNRIYVYPNGKIISHNYSYSKIIKESEIGIIEPNEVKELYDLFTDDVMKQKCNWMPYIGYMVGCIKDNKANEWTFIQIPNFLEEIDTCLNKICDKYNL